MHFFHPGSPFPSLCQRPHLCFDLRVSWSTRTVAVAGLLSRPPPPRRRELWVRLRRYRRQGLQGVLRREGVSCRRENGFRCPAVAIACERRRPRTHHQLGSEYFQLQEPLLQTFPVAFSYMLPGRMFLGFPL